MSINSILDYLTNLIKGPPEAVVPSVIVIPPVPAPVAPVSPPVVAPVVKPPVVVAPQGLYPPWITIAKSLIGTREKPGASDNPDIIHWAQEIGGETGKDYIHDSIPWCGLFMAITQKLANEPGIKTPLWAQAWKDYGTSLAEPAFGSIMVFVRPGGGHVSYYVSEDSSYYHILGGNQADSVNISRIPKSHCIACRWPPNADNYFKIGRIYKIFDGKV